MTRYKHIFFDLDHTLWDFERNSEETLHELFVDLALFPSLPTPQHFYFSFKRINRYLWSLYHFDKISKEELRTRRFEMVLEESGILDKLLAEKISDLYLQICPTKPNLLPGTQSLLEYLSGKYTLHILSNGFEDTTIQKIKASAIEKYFQTICTPSLSGHKKPKNEMFQFALKYGNSPSHQAIMIGDDLEADILGAKGCGIDQIYFNPEKIPHGHKITFEVYEMDQIKTIL